MKFSRVLPSGPRRTAHPCTIAHGDATKSDGKSLNDSDHEVSEWLNNGRTGTKPERRVLKP